jgi:hypothetical protein
LNWNWIIERGFVSFATCPLNTFFLPSEQTVIAGKGTCEIGRAVVVTVVRIGFSCQSVKVREKLETILKI